MDDCMLSKPGGDGGGYTLANVTETFHRIPFQVNVSAYFIDWLVLYNYNIFHKMIYIHIHCLKSQWRK